VGDGGEADQVDVVVFALFERRQRGTRNGERGPAQLFGGCAVGDLGKAGDRPALAVVAQLRERQRAAIEGLVHGECLDALTEQLEPNLARHAVRTRDGREHDGPLPNRGEGWERGSAGSGAVAAAPSPRPSPPTGRGRLHQPSVFSSLAPSAGASSAGASSAAASSAGASAAPSSVAASSVTASSSAGALAASSASASFAARSSARSLAFSPGSPFFGLFFGVRSLIPAASRKRATRSVACAPTPSQ